MTPDTETLEHELRSDLATLDERFADEEFSADLYRALTNTTWAKKGGPEGHLSLSWTRAERLVNDLRHGRGESALTLAQTGGEGEVSDVVADELGRLGWTHRPLNTSREDAQHVVQKEASPPPADEGEREAPVEDSKAWERQAHEEADEVRDRTGPVRPRGGAGPGGG